MKRIESRIDTSSEAYRRNHVAISALVDDFRARQERARHLCPLRSQNKLLPRERLDLLLDPGTPFLEFSSRWPPTANTTARCRVPTCITGIGVVQRARGASSTADDSGIKGGAWYPLTPRKITRLLDMAIENRLPVLHLCDSAGAFLAELSELFYIERRAHLPQPVHCCPRWACRRSRWCFGHCTAGGAYIPALCDYSVIVRGNGGVFLGGPPLVKAATGEVVTAEALGGADMHTSISGTCDYPADDEPHAFAIAATSWPRPRRPTKQRIDRVAPEPPYYDPGELYGIIPADWKTGFDMREVIARMVDGSRFHEYQPHYGTTLVCGLRAHLGLPQGRHPGQQRRAVQRQLAEGRALHRLCDRDRTPLVFLQNITGYMVGRELRGARHHQGRRQDDHDAGRQSRCPSSPSSSAGRSAPATTACAGAPTTAASCGCGRIADRR
jgi:3-methylcrotonyl-CoA carboxylase beta subunit